jgi:carbamoyltransferase
MSKDYLLSIYFGYHDSCITFADNESIVLHLQAERIFRKKRMKADIQQMLHLIDIGLEYLGIEIKNIRQVYLAKWNNLFDNDSTININGKKFQPFITLHQANHIGCAFPSNFSDSLVVCADGGSEDITSGVYLKTKNEIKLIEDLSHSILSGKFYGNITQMVINPDFSKAHNEYAGKTMGLAPFGKWSSDLHNLIKANIDLLKELHFDGCEQLKKALLLSNDYDNYTHDWRRLNLAFTAQKIWEDEWLDKLNQYKNLSHKIILTGGCALNVSLNAKIMESGMFNEIYVPPICNDTGQSLGALLFHNPNLECNYPFLGRGFGDVEDIPEQLIDDLLDHKIVCWYQGRSEIGPRALGHRSILGLPDSINMRRKISEQVKKREFYRPVAPIIPEYHVSKFFEAGQHSPYMTIAAKAKEITWKLAPAIVHIDGTSRVQTLEKAQNPLLYNVLNIIGEVTGTPILMNTSFNSVGEPIVDTPYEALQTFNKDGSDVLYINGKRYAK